MTITVQFPLLSKVRSFDFDSRKDCYVEGVLEGFDDTMFGDCRRYVIRVERVVFAGVECEDDGRIGQYVYPPLNGTPTLFRRLATDGVELVA